MDSSNLQIVSELYQAINRNDIEAILKNFDPEIVRVEFEGTPSGGTYRGLDEIRAHFSQARSTWAEGSCSPEELIPAHDKIVVHVHVKVRLKDKTEWIDGHVFDGFQFRDGKIVEFRSFFNKEEALEWAIGPS